jgi:hypothetical protein
MLLRDRVRRVLTVIKVRYSAHDVHLREFEIVPPLGLRVLAPLESDAGVLEDAARRLDLVPGGVEGESESAGEGAGEGRGAPPPGPAR